MLRMLSMSRYFKRQMHDIIECLKKHEELDVKVVETLLNHADDSVVTQLLFGQFGCLDDNAADEQRQRIRRGVAGMRSTPLMFLL